jgi:hypothetical protein
VTHHRCCGTVVESSYGIDNGFRRGYEVQLDKKDAGHSGTTNGFDGDRWFITARVDNSMNRDDTMCWSFGPGKGRDGPRR